METIPGIGLSKTSEIVIEHGGFCKRPSMLPYCCLQLSCRQVAFDHKAPRPARFSTFCNLFLDAEIEIYPFVLFVLHVLDILQVTLASWHGPSTTTKAIACLE
jgi:hypothetical protein